MRSAVSDYGLRPDPTCAYSTPRCMNSRDDNVNIHIPDDQDMTEMQLRPRYLDTHTTANGSIRRERKYGYRNGHTDNSRQFSDISADDTGRPV